MFCALMVRKPNAVQINTYVFIPMRISAVARKKG